MILVLLSAMSEWGIYVSLAETVLFVLGTAVFVRGQMKQPATHRLGQIAQARYSQAK